MAMASGSSVDHRFFMATALLVAQRSNSPIQVGACIVNDKNEIVGIGYNRAGTDHAEQTAIFKASQHLENCTLYVTLHPCNDCSEIIIQYKIKRVYYYYNKYPDPASPKLLEEYGIACVHYVPRIKLYINFRNVELESNDESDSSDETDSNNEYSEIEHCSRITWEHFFMATTYLIAQTKHSAVGACIVNDENQIVSIGYMQTENGENSSSVHAELNAILNASQQVNNCTLYVNIFPCNECASHIMQSGIRKVIYNFDKYPHTLKKLQNFGVQCIHYVPPCNLVIEELFNGN